MVESDTRSRRQERVRREILDAARALILERGVEGFSLREVAARADYTPGALYTYFCSADELLGAVGMSALGVLGGYMAQVPAGLPAPQRCVALGEAYLAFAAERPEEYSVAFERLTVPADDWHHFVRVAYPFTMLVEAFAAGVGQADFSAREGFGAAEMAYGLWCLCHGAAALRRRMLAAVSDDMRATQFETMRAYVRGLQREGTGR